MHPTGWVASTSTTSCWLCVAPFYVQGGGELSPYGLYYVATSFSLYPNPAQQQLTIQSPADKYSQLTITSIVGQQLLQQPVTQSQFTVNIRTLPPGIYYATMLGHDGIAVQKFVKY